MRINLNFLPLEKSDFPLSLYRRKFNGEAREDRCFVGKPPITTMADKM